MNSTTIHCRFIMRRSENSSMDERNAEFTYALGKAWQYIKSDGNFTHRELTEFVNTMDSSLCRKVLASLIYTVWTELEDKKSD